MAINESFPWKRALLRDAATLERRCAKTRATERRSFIVEQKVLLAAYSIRKLHQSEKLSTSFADRSMRCRSFEPTRGRLTLWNNHNLHQLYDLGGNAERTLPALRVLDLLIHSVAFGEVVNDDNSVEGFLVTSDWKREEYLLLVEMTEFVRLMREVGGDSPEKAARVYDPAKDAYEVWRGSGEPPPILIDE